MEASTIGSGRLFVQELSVFLLNMLNNLFDRVWAVWQAARQAAVFYPVPLLVYWMEVLAVVVLEHWVTVHLLPQCLLFLLLSHHEDEENLHHDPVALPAQYNPLILVWVQQRVCVVTLLLLHIYNTVLSAGLLHNSLYITAFDSFGFLSISLFIWFNHECPHDICDFLPFLSSVCRIATIRLLTLAFSLHVFCEILDVKWKLCVLLILPPLFHVSVFVVWN